jgi:hypothetical protein
MPTLTVTHEAPLEMIRQHPDLAVELVRAMTDVPVPAGGRGRLGPTDANYVVPVQFTADSVVVVDDPGTSRPALVIVIEPQGRDDKTKCYAWPAYLANIREAVKCPRAVLLVVCPDPREAEKCRRVISMGHPGWDLWPIVIDAAQRYLEELMKTDEYKNDFIESYVKVGIEQGIERGVVADAAEKLLRLLDGRGLKPTDAQRTQVAASTDLPQLNLWFDRAINAESATDVFRD